MLGKCEKCGSKLRELSTVEDLKVEYGDEYTEDIPSKVASLAEHCTPHRLMKCDKCDIRWITFLS